MNCPKPRQGHLAWKYWLSLTLLTKQIFHLTFGTSIATSRMALGRTALRASWTLSKVTETPSQVSPVSPSPWHCCSLLSSSLCTARYCAVCRYCVGNLKGNSWRTNQNKANKFKTLATSTIECGPQSHWKHIAGHIILLLWCCNRMSYRHALIKYLNKTFYSITEKAC